MGLLSGALGILGGVLGNNSAKKAEARAAARAEANRLYAIADENRIYRRGRMDFRNDQKMQFQRLRVAAEKGGFNPLTAMGNETIAPQYGGSVTQGQTVQGSGSDYSGITAGFQSIAEEFSDDTKQRRAQEQLRTDLMKIELETARAGLGQVMRTPIAVGHWGNANTGPSSVGPFIGIKPRGPSVQTTAPGKPWYSDGKRDHMDMPTSSGAGLTDISNSVLDQMGGPITVPGADGEPWGIDEVLTAVVVGSPQVVLNTGSRVYDKLASEPFIRPSAPTDNPWFTIDLTAPYDAINSVRKYMPPLYSTPATPDNLQLQP